MRYQDTMTASQATRHIVAASRATSAIGMLLITLLCIVGPSVGCTPYDAPPQAIVAGAVDGVLSEAPDPLHIQFSEPVDGTVFNLKVIRLETDAEGRLFDEDDDDATELDVLYSRTVLWGDMGGVGTWDASRTNFTIDMDTTLPVAAPLAVVLEPGLKDDKGNAWTVRQVVVFTVAFSCGGAAATTFPSAVHYMIAQVEKPIGTQLALMADLRVEAATGVVLGTFSDADRDTSIDCGQFGLSCTSDEVCRTLPAPACVAPAEQAATVDEYPDYEPKPFPEKGFHFTVRGCVQDQADGSFSFSNVPVDVNVTTPPVIVVGIIFNASFRFDAEGVLRGDGSFVSEDTLLGGTGGDKNPASGTVSTREIPADEVKPGIPEPPAFEEDMAAGE